MANNIKITKQDKANDGLEIIISDSINIENADKVKETVLQKVEKATSIKLILNNITSMDLSGVQLLAALKSYCNSRNIPVEMEYTLSEDVAQLMENCGISKILMN